MAKEEYVKDYESKQILGVLKTEPNGDVYALDFPSYRQLGVYKKAEDITCEIPSYRKISDGNSVVSLIYKAKQK